MSNFVLRHSSKETTIFHMYFLILRRISLYFTFRNIKKYFFNLCEDQIFSDPSDRGYTAPVDNLVHRVHQVPALHLFITRDGVAVIHTAPLSSCGMSHYSEVMAASRLSDGGFVVTLNAAHRIVTQCMTIMPKHIFQGTSTSYLKQNICQDHLERSVSTRTTGQSE